ncbi:TVP38/TMEM64 family protein [Neobacillus sp. SCS-31]|uniref:TVP38/TMEM64 family protein n=1 Tax=Neobacillus oceani TaxID=3115292 RepID=UPI0039068549
MNKVFSVMIAGFIIASAILYKEPIIEKIKEGEALAIPLSIIFVAILVFFPVMPFSLFAGMLGSFFGIWLGVTISLIGIGLGTMLMFLLTRYGFQEWTQSYIKKYPRIHEYEGYFEKNAFISILLVRLIPFIPSPIVNILGGLSRIPWHIFISASLLGKIPSIITFTFAGSLFFRNNFLSISIYLIYFLIVGILVMKKLQNKETFTIENQNINIK